MVVNIKKKKQVRLVNLKATRNMVVLTNVKFKDKVRELLDLLLKVPIPTIVSCVLNLVANDFVCEVHVTSM
jgi:non-homologous end joining protein Ku